MIQALNHFSQQWAEYFGLLVLQNTLFLGIIFLFLALLKNASAKTRYSITLVGLLKLLLPPLLPAPFLTSSVGAGGTLSLTIGYPVQVEPGTTTPAGSLNLYAYPFLFWATIMIIFVVLPIVSTWRLKRKLADTQKLSVQEVDANNGFGRVEILHSSHITLPLTIGILKKRIYLPSRWSSWSPACRKLVLAHELAHVKRYDGLVQYLQLLVQAIYFFHPMVWLLSVRTNEYREMACDDDAIASAKIAPLDYSRYLVHIAENMVRTQLGYTSVSALLRKKNKLLKRVNYQIKEAKMKHLSKSKTMLIVTGLLVLMLPLSWYCSKEKPPEHARTPAESKKLVASIDSAGAGARAGAEGNREAFVAYDEPPQPIGGFAAIQRNLHYPEIARKAGIEGRAVVKVLIDENGTVVDTEVLKSLGRDNGCDQAAINALKSVKWQPAKYKGKPVKVWVSIPVVFRLAK